jgi:hypothetical protein
VRWLAKAVLLDVAIKSDQVSAVISGDRGVSVCIKNARVDSAGKLQMPTVTPTFTAHGDLANLVKKVWDFSFQATEGILTASVVSFATNASSVLTGLFPVDYCG